MIETWNLISFATVLLYLLIAVSFWLASEPSRTRTYLVFGLITLAGLASAPFYNMPAVGAFSALQVVPYTLANLVPVAAALVLFQLFEERDVSSPLFWGLAALAIGLDSADFVISQNGNWPSEFSLIILFEYLPQFAKLSFLLLGAYALLRSWRADLVQGRFRLRFAILIAVSVIGLEMLVVENLLAIRYYFPFDPQRFHAVWQLGLAIGIFFAYMRPLTIDWIALEVKQESEASERHEAQSRLDWDKHKRELESLFASRQIFRDADLNLASLAKAMALPEYRLRQLINKELGYKNFNVFLNDHRIEAAARDLLDSKNSHLPILTIALDTGYRSIAPFNKAFKERKGVTPSEFRRGHVDETRVEL